MDTNTTPFLTWVSPPSPRPARGKIWYGTTITLAVLLVGHSLWTGNWLFALLLIGIAGYYLTEDRWLPRQSRTVALSEQGITISGRETSWPGLRRVWFHERPGSVELHLERLGGLQRHDVLLLPGGVDKETLAGIFQNRVALEINRHETMLDIITNILKI